ncbi:carbohydrate-binding domain-containing protein, partial [Anaerosolibacter sp.]|uniref:carbohydrate-binding domain-containing protein n=1 Tax=Anaerosolibacter sp. TaxID=1872527 RepID=UPI0039EF7A14
MNRKQLYLKLLTVLLCTSLLLACSTNAKSQIDLVTEQLSSNAAGVENISAVISQMVSYERDDNYSDWKNENPSYIEFNETNAIVNGSGVEVKDGQVKITAAGVYAFSGKLDNGQIIVDVQNKGNVKLILNGVEINSADNAPIYVKNAGKTIITLQEGTENFISDGAEYILADASSDEPNAAIFSKDSLTINGSGTVTVRGNYNDGITSKDDLKITGGKIQIYSTDDGLIGRDMVAVKGGNITIEAGGDGIKATNDTDASKGFIALEGGSFDIKSEKDGIQAETSLLISDGTYNIFSGGGNTKGTVKVDAQAKGPWRNPKGNRDTSTSATPTPPEPTTTPASQPQPITANTSVTEEESKKGIKAAIDISIGGGTFHIDSADDAIHSNTNVTINGGDISIASGDDGIHADTVVKIDGGKINITKSYEGIEGTEVTIGGGEIHVTASDDGINVAGGNDGSAVNGRPGENNFGPSENTELTINGGYISVDSSGDGLDANGSIYMSGGTVLVNGPTAGNNGALDYDRTFEMTGGFLIAAGSSGMAQAPSEESTQYAT